LGGAADDDVMATATLSPAGEAQWERLRRLLDWSDGFWLSFVYVRAPAALPMLRERVSWNRAAHAQDAVLRVAHAPAELARWTSDLVEQLCPPRGVTWIEGVPPTVDEPWTDAWSRVLAVLNHRRDIVRTRAGGILLVLPQALQPLAAQRASDLWSVRSPSFTVSRDWVSVENEDREKLPTPPEPLPRARRGTSLAFGRQQPSAEITRRAARWLASDARSGRWLDDAVALARDAKHEGADQLAAVVLLRLAEHVVDEDPARATGAVTEALELDQIDDDTRATLLEIAGRLALERGQVQSSRDCYERSLGLRRRLADLVRIPEALRNLSVSLNTVGRVRAVAGDRAGAEAAYTESSELARRLVSQVGTPESVRDLSISLNNEGRAREASRDWAGAEAAYTESLELRRQLVDQVGSSGALRDLSVSLDNVGRVREAAGDWAGAEAAYTESLELRRRLVAELDTADAGRDLSISLDNVGRVREAAGDWAGAEAAYTESLDLARRLLDQSGSPQAARDLAVCLALLAGVPGHRSDPSPNALLAEAKLLAERIGDHGLVATLAKVAARTPGA
jgi:tetratricopeptide (TPR) repeat protein